MQFTSHNTTPLSLDWVMFVYIPTCIYFSTSAELRYVFFVTPKTIRRIVLRNKPSIPPLLLLATFDNDDVQTHDLDNDAGSKQRWEAATDALGLDLRLEMGVSSPAGLYRARESPGSLDLLGKERNTPLYYWDWVTGLNLKLVSALSSGLQQSRGRIWSDKDQRTCKLG